MISFLIPIYNWDVRNLVKTISNQIDQVGIPAEVVCLDDHSAETFKMLNREIQSYAHCTYSELPANVGRSKIRNILALKSQYSNLVFIDGDSSILQEDYVLNYHKAFQQHAFIYGGTIYREEIPDNRDWILRWKYGQKKEALSAKDREIKDHVHFMTNNFGIEKQLWNHHRFDESISTYGYEDFVFAKNILNQGIQLFQMDNPVQHDGLDDSKTFLKKTNDALENLLKLYQDQEIQTPITNAYRQLKRTMMIKVYAVLFTVFTSAIERNLHSKKPSLWLFNIWKLGNFIKLTIGKNIKDE